MFARFIIIVLLGIFIMAGCKDESTTEPEMKMPLDPATATRASIDRFSASAGHLFVRDGMNGFPGADAPIDCDQIPFITKGLGPSGQTVQYYNFDVQSTIPAPIYVLFKEGESMPVDGQLNIVDVKPGDTGYNDFWQVVKVTVPSSYVANTVTSYQEISAAGYATETTTTVVNCPIVPDGSTADLRIGGGTTGLIMGWYKSMIVTYFTFEEKALMTQSNMVPTSPIYVCFNINPGMDGGGPPSGFLTETGSDQTHNVAATIPSDAGYSPLWLVNIYDNAEFDDVMDLTTAQNATIMAPGAAIVNCPIVSVE